MSYPREATVVEVGPRDGFQNVKNWIPTETKMKIINALIRANLQNIEATSFVHPKAIPQMQDAALVTKEVLGQKEAGITALVPNLPGAKAAWAAGLRKVTYVISASERHNMENVRRTIAESFADLRTLKSELPQLQIKLSLATVFGCPFAGDVPVAQVLRMAETALAVQVDEICLCDTIGVANPLQMERVLTEVNIYLGGPRYSLHLHDTRGMGLANVIVALQQGVTVFEAAVGGLGGCPFAPGAAGNIATEDLVNMLQQMDIKTGVNLPLLLEAARLVKSEIAPDLTGHLVNVRCEYPDNRFENMNQ